MKINDKKTAGETANLWEEGVDYTLPSPDRPYKLRLEIGAIVYLNKKQYASMQEDHWEEKRQQYLDSRCIVSAERGGLKRCTEDCMHYKGEDKVCSCFMRNNNGGTVSLDKLYDDNNYEAVDSSSKDIADLLAYEERLNSVIEAVDKLAEDVDKRIIRLFMDSFTERQIAEVLGWNQMKVNRRKKKIFDELRSKLQVK